MYRQVYIGTYQYATTNGGGVVPSSSYLTPNISYTPNYNIGGVSMTGYVYINSLISNYIYTKYNIDISGNINVSGNISYYNLPILGSSGGEIVVSKETLANGSKAYKLCQTTSSNRHVNRIFPVDGTKYNITTFMQIHHREYYVKEGYGNVNVKHLGFIAEELNQLGLNELINLDDDGQPQSVLYDRFTVFLVKTVQEQQTKINNLTTALYNLSLIVNDISLTLNSKNYRNVNNGNNPFTLLDLSYLG
jgi:hypothetical protein